LEEPEGGAEIVESLAHGSPREVDGLLGDEATAFVMVRWLAAYSTLMVGFKMNVMAKAAGCG
jgi:hypothetical protein